MCIYFMAKELIISLTGIELINSDSIDRSEGGNKTRMTHGWTLLVLDKFQYGAREVKENDHAENVMFMHNAF